MGYELWSINTDIDNLVDLISAGQHTVNTEHFFKKMHSGTLK